MTSVITMRSLLLKIHHQHYLRCFYCKSAIDSVPNLLVLFECWGSMTNRFLFLSSITRDAIWMPVTSVDAERKKSLYKHLLNDRREGLTEENTKRLTMLYFNGNIEGQLK